MNTWLILDCNYLARRALYSMGNLSHRDVKTGVVYGFFKDVQNLQEHFGTPYVAFCFDYGKGLRKDFFPAYKQKRHSKPLTEEELEVEIAYKKQERLLREVYLPRLGYNNVFYQEGYEGDDIIASVTNNSLGAYPAIIITADKDLYQLITSRVSFYNPTMQKTVTFNSFNQYYRDYAGLKYSEFYAPDYWKVLAIAGCTTDEVPGVKGVGVKTAIRYLTKNLKKTTVVYKRIRSEEGIAIRKRNTRLVKLPYPGTKRFKLTDDNLSQSKWKSLAKHLGFKSLIDRKAIRTPKQTLGVGV